MKKARVILDRIVELPLPVVGIMVVCGMLVITVSILFRYYLNRPIPGVEVGCEIMLIYLTFLSASWILRNEKHVRVDIVLNLLSPRIQAMLGIVTSIVGAVICLVLVVYGAEATWLNYLSGVDTGGTVSVPVFILQVVIPTGSFLLLLQFLRRGYGYLGQWRCSGK